MAKSLKNVVTPNTNENVDSLVHRYGSRKWCTHSGKEYMDAFPFNPHLRIGLLILERVDMGGGEKARDQKPMTLR